MAREKLRKSPPSQPGAGLSPEQRHQPLPPVTSIANNKAAPIPVISPQEFLALSPEQRERLRQQIHARAGAITASASLSTFHRSTNEPLKYHKNHRKAEREKLTSPGPADYFNDSSSNNNNSGSIINSVVAAASKSASPKHRSKEESLRAIHDEMAHLSASRFANDVMKRSVGPGPAIYETAETRNKTLKSAPAISLAAPYPHPQVQPLPPVFVPAIHDFSRKKENAALQQQQQKKQASPLRSAIRGYSMSGRGHEFVTVACASPGSPLYVRSPDKIGTQLMACSSPHEITPGPGAYAPSITGSPPKRTVKPPKSQGAVVTNAEK